jgi:hypothetical protein
MKRTTWIACLWLAGCGGSSEAPTVELPVVVDGTGLTEATTDLGYGVTVDALRAAIRDLELTVQGETHEGPVVPLRAAPGAPNLAHPGHLAGGEVTGELPGDFLIDWTADGAALGTATLIVGAYQGANFSFRRAGAADGLAEDDPLLGHTLVLEGSADGGDGAVDFVAVIDIDEDTPMVGAPFRLDVDEETTSTLALGALTIDPTEGDTLFDGVDFAAVAGESPLALIEPGSDAHNVLKRNVQIHDHYVVHPREEERR